MANENEQQPSVGFAHSYKYDSKGKCTGFSIDIYLHNGMEFIDKLENSFHVWNEERPVKVVTLKFRLPSTEPDGSNPIINKETLKNNDSTKVKSV